MSNNAVSNDDRAFQRNMMSSVIQIAAPSSWGWVTE
jgi:hypothetical protein